MTDKSKAVSAEQADRMRWLGRYAERVCSTLKIVNRYLDVMIDGESDAYKRFCKALSIPSDIYEDAADFEEHYLYDPKNPDSIYSNLSRAYDNALILRNFISSETMSFIQMSLDRLETVSSTSSAFLETQQIIDWILAFWGSLEDALINPSERALILVGKYIERLDLQLRLEEPLIEMQNTVPRLRLYLERSGLLEDVRGCERSEALTALELILQNELDEKSRNLAIKALGVL